VIGIDLRNSDPRSPLDVLGGVKLLARIIDKARASVAGTNGRYIFYDCPLDRAFFDRITVTRNARHYSQDQRSRRTPLGRGVQ
jgi:Domain of unknown function (DUF5069)